MVLRPLDKVESREPSPFYWAVTPPEQSPCLLLLLHQLSGSGAGWAESSKAGRLSSPDTRSLGTPPNPTPPNLATPLAPGSQAHFLALSLGPQRKQTVLHPWWNVKAQGAHQTNRREQKFAFCSGLVFTSADTGSILSAKADTDRGLPAQAAVGLLLLLEALVGMLETGRLAGPLGRSLRTPASESGAPFVHQVRLPRLSGLQGPPLKHPLFAGAATGIGWMQRATCGAAGPRDTQVDASRSLTQVGGKVISSLIKAAG